MPTYRVFDTEAIPTTEDLLNEYLVNMVSTATGVTDISVGSKMWSIGYTVARQQSSIYYTLHFYRKQSYVLTATGKYLDLHGIEVGILRHQATSATGTVVFYRDAPAPIDIVIPAGTIVSTPIVSSNIPTSKYSTSEDVILAVGETEVSAPVSALTAGPDGNLPAGSVNRIESTLPGAQRVTSGVISGGQEIEEDESYRQRILTAWAARETGTTAAIRNAVLGVPGIRNVMIIDPARNRVGQYIKTMSSVSNEEQLKIDTLSPLEAKYDIDIEMVSTETGLTMTLQQVNELGNVLNEEIIEYISSGWDLLDKINSWSRSGTLYLTELFLDDNPYDDPIKQSTDNEIIFIKTKTPTLQFEPVIITIEEMPVVDPVTNDTTGETQKRITIATQTQYYHNQILGQTEKSPLVEVFDNIGTYGNMVNVINEQSNLITMKLLDQKTATQTLNPEPYEFGENIVNVDFTPIVEIVSPIHEDIHIIDSENGIVGVGQISSPFELVYKYRAKTVDGEGNTVEFGDKIVEDAVIALQSDGSELVVATPIMTPDIVSNVGLNFCDELPQPIIKTKMESIYKLVRGRIDVTIVPYSLTEEPNAALMAAVVAAVEKVRPAGVEVNIIYPNTRLVDVSVNVEVLPGTGYDPSQFYDIIKTNITDYINGLEMGETAYIDRIIAAANPDIKGLKVARVKSPSADIIVPFTAFLRAGTVYFNISAEDFAAIS